MNDKKNSSPEKAVLSDEALDKVVGGGINPFNPEGICSKCKVELGGTYHVVTEQGVKFYLCDDCHKKYQAKEFRFFTSLSYG